MQLTPSALCVSLALCLIGCSDSAKRDLPRPNLTPVADVSTPRSIASVGSSLPWEPVRFPPPGEDAASRRYASRGPDAPLVSDSLRPLARDTPTRLLHGTLLSLTLRDLPALARLSSGRTGALTEDDVMDARRRFLQPGPREAWARIAEAVQRGAYRVDLVADDTATIHVSVGGAAGAYAIQLQKGDAGWFLAN